jgi:hypothetical protein
MKTVVVQAQQRWDNSVISRRSETALLNEVNQAGQQGWEMVTVMYYKDRKGEMLWTAFLKRPNTGGGIPADAAATTSSVLH